MACISPAVTSRVQCDLPPLIRTGAPQAFRHDASARPPAGAGKLSRPGRKGSSPNLGSGSDGRGFPRPVRLGAQDPETWSGDQVRLDIERVVDGGVAGKEPLG